MFKEISVIIPTWNEEESITPLIRRLAKIFQQKNINYELIFVDDRSTDKTAMIIKNYLKIFNVFFYLKSGKKGKAFSLLEGFAKAKYKYTAFIDADLQYPPEEIPEMLNKIDQGFDIVVANRKESQTNILRKLLSNSFKLIFAKTLHGFDVDVQSGLKVFRSKILKKIPLSPSPWTIDLEFLLQARDRGYKITSHDISFGKRNYGKSKVNLIRTSLEIGLSSLKLKLLPREIVPYSLNKRKAYEQGFYFKGIKYNTYSNLEQEDSAFFRISKEQKYFISAAIFTLTAGFILNWHLIIVILFTLFTLIYFADLLFNLFLIYRSMAKLPEIRIGKKEINKIRDWPKYTIFCPLYKEANVARQFTKAIFNLDYPKNRLQILLLLESEDNETISKISKLKLPSYFKSIIVPVSSPKTKPKALNYGLKYARGKYCVIYDAEDIPEPDQLKKTVIAFENRKNKNITCIQAKLNFYNPKQNILTKIFTGEYSLWFNLVLPGLQSLSAPIPLGGTSNHFPTRYLRQLEGWDAFNVTEDCDLGIRLTKKGSLTAIVNSQTLEEANSSIKYWFPQRSRWIKGYIQTYLVHMRYPKTFIDGAGFKNFLIFQLTVGGKIFSMFINPLMWLTTIIYFCARPVMGDLIESFFLTPVFYMAVTSTIFGNFIYFYNYMLGCMKKEQYDLIKYTYLVPLYWISISVAAWIAVIKFLQTPFYWAKTPHGLHLRKGVSFRKIGFIHTKYPQVRLAGGYILGDS